MPRKNVVDFAGRPIIAYTIEAALRSGLFRRVIVSTEDAKIADVSARYGAEVDARPPHLASDTATVVEVCLDLLERQAMAGLEYDVICCLYATAPLRVVDDIHAVVGLIEPGQCDFAMAVTAYDLPPQQALRRDSGGDLTPLFPDLVGKKSQEIGELVVDNGSTYAASIPAFRDAKSFYGPRLAGHFMARERSVDLDEPGDLELLNFFAQRRMR